MGLYSALCGNNRLPTAHANEIVCEILPGATSYPVITEIEATYSPLVSPSQGGFSIGYSSSLGVPLFGPPVVAADFNQPSADFQIVVDWLTRPGLPTRAIRTLQCTGQVSGSSGNNVIYWNFPRGLKLAPTQSLVLYGNAWNITRPPTQYIRVEVDG